MYWENTIEHILLRNPLQEKSFIVKNVNKDSQTPKMKFFFVIKYFFLVLESITRFIYYTMGFRNIKANEIVCFQCYLMISSIHP